MNALFLSLIEGDEEAFEACVKDRTAYVVYGSRSNQIRTDDVMGAGG